MAPTNVAVTFGSMTFGKEGRGEAKEGGEKHLGDALQLGSSIVSRRRQQVISS